MNRKRESGSLDFNFALNDGKALIFWQRSVLVVGAVRAVEGKLRVEEDSAGDSKYADEVLKRVFSCYYNAFVSYGFVEKVLKKGFIVDSENENASKSERGSKSDKNKGDKEHYFYERFKKLFIASRNFLSHVSHAPVILTEEGKDFLQYLFNESCAQNTAGADVFRELKLRLFAEVNGDCVFTIVGMVFLLCLILEKSYANRMLDSFHSFLPREYRPQSCSDDMKKLFTHYSTRDGINVRGAFSQLADDEEAYSEWKLISEIASHISKPLKNSALAEKQRRREKNRDRRSSNKEKSNEKIHIRTEDKGMIDYFILRWLKFKLPQLEFACKALDTRENKHSAKVSNRVVPQFSKDNEETAPNDYYKRYDQYYCRIPADEDTYSHFKLHRNHLLEIAEILLSGDQKTAAKEVMKKIKYGLNIMADEQRIRGNYEKLKPSLPRTLRRKFSESHNDWAPASIETRIAERKKLYKATMEGMQKLNQLKRGEQNKRLRKISGELAQFIAWALQHPLNKNISNATAQANKESKSTVEYTDFMIRTEQYQRLTAMISYYADKPNFQEKVIETLNFTQKPGLHSEEKQKRYAEKHKVQNENLGYMKNYIKKNIIDTTLHICKELNKLSNTEDELRRHTIRQSDPRAENHWLLNRQEHPKGGPVWLPKNCFDRNEFRNWDGETLDYLAPENYFPQKFLHSDNTILFISRDSNEKPNSNDIDEFNEARTAYLQDRLLLRIARSGTHENLTPDGSSSPLSIGSLLVEVSSKESNAQCSDVFKIPLKYFARSRYMRSKNKFHHALCIAKRQLIREGKTKPSDEAIVDYYFDNLVTQYQRYSKKFLSKLFHIESKAAEKYSFSPSSKGGYIKFKDISSYMFSDSTEREKFNEIRNKCFHGEEFLKNDVLTEIKLIDRACKDLDIRSTLSEDLQNKQRRGAKR